jgi:hypothetical protein
MLAVVGETGGIEQPRRGLAVPARLGDLPGQRAAWLVRWWGRSLRGAGAEVTLARIEQNALDRARRPCRVDGWGTRPTLDVRAGLGSDGRFHLVRNGIVLCRGGPAAAGPGVAAHQQWCHWWSDRHQFRLQAPSPAQSDGKQHRWVRWPVVIDSAADPAAGTLLLPEHVPVVQRCPNGQWPGRHHRQDRMGRIRIELAQHFGRACSGCGRRPFDTVDHDHFSWLVRGGLCRNCNTQIEQCPHLAGCRWAEYLNAPPGFALGIRFPRGAPKPEPWSFLPPPDRAAMEQLLQTAPLD